MVIFLLEALTVITALVGLAWFLILLFSDADVLLTLKSKFGKQPGQEYVCILISCQFFNLELNFHFVFLYIKCMFLVV